GLHRLEKSLRALRKGRHPALFRGKRLSQIGVRRHQGQLRLSPRVEFLAVGQAFLPVLLQPEESSACASHLQSHLCLRLQLFCSSPPPSRKPRPGNRSSTARISPAGSTSARATCPSRTA